MSSDTYNHLAIDDAHPLGDPEPAEESDTSGLTEADQEKLAVYDILACDTRSAARNVCIWLSRYKDVLPPAALNDMRRILHTYLMPHLAKEDREAFWDKVAGLVAGDVLERKVG